MATAVLRGHTVTSQGIESAMKDFDHQYSGERNAYDLWLDKNTYKWALRYKDRLYPQKYILSLATGMDTTDFTAAEARRVLGNLGFEIVRKP